MKTFNNKKSGKFSGTNIVHSGKFTSEGSIATKNGNTSAGFIEFFEDSDNGTNKVTLIGPASTSDINVTLPDAAGTLITESQTFTARSQAGANSTDDIVQHILHLHNRILTLESGGGG